MRRALAPLLLVASCDALDDAPRPAPSVRAAPTASAAPEPAPTAPAPAPSGAADAVLEVRKLTLAAGVEKREPTGELAAAGPGERAYAHLVVRNRRNKTETVTVRFSVGGEERSSVDLDVQHSWSFRTWAYATPQKKDVGKELEVEVFERGGRSLARAAVPIAKEPKTR